LLSKTEVKWPPVMSRRFGAPVKAYSRTVESIARTTYWL
jgi:hypothetical protein